MPISWLDIILIAIMLISGFLAMVRGFTREVLSVFSWAVAAVAALYLTPKYWEVLQPYIDKPSIAQIVFAAGVFVVSLIVVSLITFRISDKVLDSRVGALDRTLGFIFGLARGFLLVAIVFILFTALARDQPEWVRNARSYPDSPADPGRHRISAADEPRAISAEPRRAAARRSAARNTTTRPAATSGAGRGHACRARSKIVRKRVPIRRA